MKKLLFLPFLFLLSSVHAQNLPLIGMVSPGQVQNIMTNPTFTNNTRFMLKNSGLVPLQFYMAANTTAQPTTGAITVAAASQIEVSVGDLGGISLGKNLNVKNEAISPEKLGLFNVLQTFPIQFPTLPSCASLLGPQWLNNGITGKNLYVCPTTDIMVGIGTSTPQANFHVTGTTRFDATSQFGSNTAMNANLSVARSLIVGSSLAVKYPPAEFTPAILANGYGRFGVDDNYIDIGAGAQYGTAGTIQSHGSGGLSVNYLGGGDIGLYGNVHISPYFQSSILPNLTVDGKLGVGTSNPVSKVDIQNGTGSTEVRMYSTNTTTASTTFWAINNKYSFGFGIDVNGVGNISSNVNGVSQIMTFNSAGNVGIGTSSPGTCKLAVEGVIGAREVKVLASSTAFPDYVFDKNYKLITIAELESFITKNHHLPEIPSAMEVEKNNGIDLGEMNIKLLKKVEEMSLYIIEMKKEIEELKAKTK